MKISKLDRRSFVKTTATALVASSLPSFPKATSVSAAQTAVGIYLSSYWLRFREGGNAQYPTWKGALEMAQHCHDIGAGGAQVGVRNWDMDYAKKMRDLKEKTGMWLEGSLGLPRTEAEVDHFEKQIMATKEAGIEVNRTACLSGRRYMTFKNVEDWNAFKKGSLKAMRLSEPIARKHGVKLAIENHKDWTADELVQIMKDFDSEYMGVNLDTGNNISFLEDPYEVVEKLAPYALTTHFKDMGIEQYEDGFLLSEVPYGEGFLDLNRMMITAKKYNPLIKFNLEMMTRDPLKIPFLTDDYWTTFGDRLSKDTVKSIKLIRENYADKALPRVEHKPHVDQLADEERNQIACLDFARKELGLMS